MSVELLWRNMGNYSVTFGKPASVELHVEVFHLVSNKLSTTQNHYTSFSMAGSLCSEETYGGNCGKRKKLLQVRIEVH